jgi:hypothetical protein
VQAGEVIEEPSDGSAADDTVQTVVDIGVNGDGDFFSWFWDSVLPKIPILRSTESQKAGCHHSRLYFFQADRRLHGAGHAK